MPEPAYIIIADDGHITLYWGDGTEPEPHVLWQGPRALDARQIAADIEQITLWAEANGYIVVVPAYDPLSSESESDLVEHDIPDAGHEDAGYLLDDLFHLSDNDVPGDGWG